MKKNLLFIVLIVAMCFMIQGCNSKKENSLTKEMAYEGVNNYCHLTYDWSVAEDNPSIMYVEMVEESATEYLVKFRSYTGAFVYFYVDKSNGNTRIIEFAPNFEDEKETGTININEYLVE